MNVAIRSATSADAGVCRALLPEASRGGLHEFLIAAIPERPFVAGAAAFLRFPSALESVHVHVLPALRRRGVGSRLIEEIARVAAAAGVASISGWTERSFDGRAEAFAGRHGFQPAGRLTRVECAADSAHHYSDRIAARWTRRGVPPAGFRIVALREAGHDAVMRFCQHSNQPGLRASLYAHEIACGCFDDSPVLLRDARVAGFALVRFEHDSALVLAEAIEPAARNGWSAAALNVAVCKTFRAHGVQRIFFEWREDVAFTAKLAQRLKARVVCEFAELVRRL